MLFRLPGCYCKSLVTIAELNGTCIVIQNNHIADWSCRRRCWRAAEQSTDAEAGDAGTRLIKVAAICHVLVKPVR